MDTLNPVEIHPNPPRCFGHFARRGFQGSVDMILEGLPSPIRSTQGLFDQGL